MGKTGTPLRGAVNLTLPRPVGAVFRMIGGGDLGPDLEARLTARLGGLGWHVDLGAL